MRDYLTPRHVDYALELSSRGNCIFTNLSYYIYQNHYLKSSPLLQMNLKLTQLLQNTFACWLLMKREKFEINIFRAVYQRWPQQFLPVAVSCCEKTYFEILVFTSRWASCSLVQSRLHVGAVSQTEAYTSLEALTRNLLCEFTSAFLKTLQTDVSNTHIGPSGTFNHTASFLPSLQYL